MGFYVKLDYIGFMAAATGELREPPEQYSSQPDTQGGYQPHE